jgi:hypothetical protein
VILKHALALLVCFLLGLASPRLFAQPVITEFMASNASTLADEDGAFSDWIEIFNPTSTAISLDQWCLTDNAALPAKWRFPNVSLEPGGFLVVWASGKNRRTPGAPLHTNFSLAAGGEYLGLIAPDGISVVQDFGAAYPPQVADESFGRIFNRQVWVAPGATTRYRTNQSSTNPPSNWRQVGFNDGSWASGPSGLGHGLTVPGITLRHVFKKGTLYGGLTEALDLLALPAGDSGIALETTVTVPMVNFLGEGGEGRYENNALPPAGVGDHYAVRATGFVQIPTSGDYTFGINSDDGGRIRINGSDLMVDDSYHGPLDNFGTINLSAGTHSFEVIMFEGQGGDSLEFFAAPGSYSSFDPGVFRLVGDTAAGGLAASTLPEGAGGVFATNLQSVMASRNGASFRNSFIGTGAATATTLSLVTRHNDGFAAWINNSFAASHNAPTPLLWNSTATAARTNSESLRKMGFNLSSFLPSINPTGNNVLAIHGMKSSTSDTSFLILPELIAGSLHPTLPPAYYVSSETTPGWINGSPGSFGTVATPTASVPQGFYENAFAVTLATTTPGAEIRYTTDGSTPSATNGQIATGPISITGTTTLRVIAVQSGWDPSETITRTYLFLDDILTQSADGSPPPGWPSGPINSQLLDYGMDPEIIGSSNPDIGGTASVKAALTSLPAVSIVTDLPNLFDINGSQGIYTNPYGRGLAWERPASLEWIEPPDASNPNGRAAFQVNAGLRLRGGFSRSTENPKHSFRFFFRSDYGPTKLEYPLFGPRGAQIFDQIDFRTAQNYSWAFGGDDNNTFLREEATRQAQLDMGQPASRVRYFHLFLNGQYWGLFNLDERTEADFAETYFGGDSTQWDVVKAEQTAGYTVGATDGNLNAWQDLWNKGKIHRDQPTNANYFRLMGRAADGVTATTDPVLLDVDNLIDYLLLTFWTGNLDGCTSAFLGNDRANNWFGSRRRDNNPGQGFRFFAHDFEHTFFNPFEDRTGPYSFPNEEDFAFSNPLFLHQDLLANAEYRIRWADRIHKHLFNGGALETTPWLNRINRLATSVEPAIIAESARWGDAKSEIPKTKQTWLGARNSLLSYFPQRSPIVLQQLRDDGLYPAIDAPTLTPFGSYQESGVELTLSAPSGGTIHYMADGSDPRAVGGALRPGALTHVSSTSNETLIPWSAAGWRYLSDGSNQGSAWRLSAFNDGPWSSGTAELGYGDGDEATVIPITESSPGQKTATSYFRRTFQVTDPATITGLSAQVEYDDGYAIYLNGTRIGGNLPENPAHNYFTGSAIEDSIDTLSIDPALLVAGTNLLAIEIHQANPTSSDVSMNASLSAVRSTTPTPIFLTGNGARTFRSRVRDGSTWSALTEATFLLETDPASSSNPAISKIHYHPTDPSPAEIGAGFDDASDFEYIELLNTGTRHVDLTGLLLSGGVRFDFNTATTGRTLAPGARLLVVANQDAFDYRYGAGLPVAGRFSGNLNNAGETLLLLNGDDEILRSVTYDDAAPWPLAADGNGPALVRRHPAESGGDNDPEGWTAAGSFSGSPGLPDSPMPGTFDAWAAGRFSPAQLAASASSAPGADPDGDGRSNAEEYALATDPVTADRPRIRFVWRDDGSVRRPAIEVRRPQFPTDLSYELLASDSLDGGWTVVTTFATDATPAGAGREDAVFVDPTATTSPTRFLRIRATWTP